MVTIDSIETLLVDLPTIRPHQLSMTTMKGQTLMIVRITCSDGSVGIGEGTTFTEEFIQQHPDIVKGMQDQFANLDAEGYAACCDALGASDLRKGLNCIIVPTLLVAGKYDPVCTVKDAHDMNGLIKGSSVAVLEASHISNVEDADAFTKTIVDFIDAQ